MVHVNLILNQLNICFYRAKVATQIWLKCYAWTSPTFSTVQHGDLVGHLKQFAGVVSCKKESEMWQTLWCALIFCIRRARNNKIFNNIEVDILKLMEDIKFQSWSWLYHQQPGSNHSIVLWSGNPVASIGGGKVKL